MKQILITCIVLVASVNSILLSQTQSAPKLYAHKVVVDSAIQTKAYTYLKVNENVKGKDSVQWLALPLIEAKKGDVFYFNSGMQMGQFHSNELDRNFSQILFLATLGTTPEISEKNIVPAPVMDTIPKNTIPRVIHTVVVKEVLQAGGYTYMRVKEGDKEEWLAVVKKQALVGQTYTFDDAAPMKDFTSKELKRTFPEILFLAKLTLVDKTETEPSSDKKDKHSAKTITVAKLLENKKSYAGKTVKLEGKVTKYSADILNKNWIHIEDGTDFSGKYDVTVTTGQVTKVGDKVIVEGKISLNKDFGSGYFFDIIMEDAALKIK